METVDVEFKVIENGKLPTFESAGAVCADCYARIGTQFIKIPQHSRCLVNLGFAVAIPEGYEIVIRPRSGLTRIGVDIGIGTIDTDYRGEVKACVINNTCGDYVLNNGDRICQMALRPVQKMKIKVVKKLSATERGEKGFGSTGI
jgi:dUTP pyrophosphatase